MAQSTTSAYKNMGNDIDLLTSMALKNNLSTARNCEIIEVWNNDVSVKFNTKQKRFLKKGSSTTDSYCNIVAKTMILFNINSLA